MPTTATLHHFQLKRALHQQILVDLKGFIFESTDTIFSTSSQRNRPVVEWSPFFESIFPTLLSLNLSSAEIHFPQIQSLTNQIFGLFDCSFMRVEWGDNQQVIVWNIIDNSVDLNHIQMAQQILNDIRLRY